MNRLIVSWWVDSERRNPSYDGWGGKDERFMTSAPSGRLKSRCRSPKLTHGAERSRHECRPRKRRSPKLTHGAESGRRNPTLTGWGLWVDLALRVINWNQHELAVAAAARYGSSRSRS